MSDGPNDVDQTKEKLDALQMPRLVISRNIYPVTKWHWSVEDECAHCPKSSDSFDSLEAAVKDAMTSGVEELNKTERRWARYNPKFARLAGIKVSEPCFDVEEKAFWCPSCGTLVRIAFPISLKELNRIGAEFEDRHANC